MYIFDELFENLLHTIFFLSSTMSEKVCYKNSEGGLSKVESWHFRADRYGAPRIHA